MGKTMSYLILQALQFLSDKKYYKLGTLFVSIIFDITFKPFIIRLYIYYCVRWSNFLPVRRDVTYKESGEKDLKVYISPDKNYMQHAKSLVYIISYPTSIAKIEIKISKDQVHLFPTISSYPNVNVIIIT